jgi:hypothetical protein
MRKHFWPTGDGRPEQELGEPAVRPGEGAAGGDSTAGALGTDPPPCGDEVPGAAGARQPQRLLAAGRGGGWTPVEQPTDGEALQRLGFGRRAVARVGAEPARAVPASRAGSAAGAFGRGPAGGRVDVGPQCAGRGVCRRAVRRWEMGLASRLVAPERERAYRLFRQVVGAFDELVHRCEKELGDVGSESAEHDPHAEAEGLEHPADRPRTRHLPPDGEKGAENGQRLAALGSSGWRKPNPIGTRFWLPTAV